MLFSSDLFITHLLSADFGFQIIGLVLLLCANYSLIKTFQIVVYDFSGLHSFFRTWQNISRDVHLKIRK